MGAPSGEGEVTVEGLGVAVADDRGELPWARDVWTTPADVLAAGELPADGAAPALSASSRFRYWYAGRERTRFGCPVGLGPLPVRGIDGTGAHQEGAVHVRANVAVGQSQAGVQLQLKTSGLGVVADSGHRRGVFRGGRHLYCCVFGDDPRWCSKLDGCRCVARRGRRPLDGGARRRWGLGDDGWRARRSTRRRRVRGGAGVRSTSIAVAPGDRPG